MGEHALLHGSRRLARELLLQLHKSAKATIQCPYNIPPNLLPTFIISDKLLSSDSLSQKNVTRVAM